MVRPESYPYLLGSKNNIGRNSFLSVLLSWCTLYVGGCVDVGELARRQAYEDHQYCLALGAMPGSYLYDDCRQRRVRTRRGGDYDAYGYTTSRQKVYVRDVAPIYQFVQPSASTTRMIPRFPSIISAPINTWQPPAAPLMRPPSFYERELTAQRDQARWAAQEAQYQAERARREGQEAREASNWAAQEAQYQRDKARREGEEARALSEQRRRDIEDLRTELSKPQHSTPMAPMAPIAP